MKLFAPILKSLGKILACLERIDKKMPPLSDVLAAGQEIEGRLEADLSKLLDDKKAAEAKAADLQTQLDAANAAKADSDAKLADAQQKLDADAQEIADALQLAQANNDKLTALENLVNPPAAPPEQPAPLPDANAPAPDNGVTAPVPDVPAPVQGTDIPVLQPVPASDGLQQSLDAVQGVA